MMYYNTRANWLMCNTRVGFVNGNVKYNMTTSNQFFCCGVIPDMFLWHFTYLNVTVRLQLCVG